MFQMTVLKRAEYTAAFKPILNDSILAFRHFAQTDDLMALSRLSLVVVGVEN